MTRNLFSFFSEDGAGRKRGRDEPKPAVKDQGEDCAPEVVGGADSVQTIQGLIPVGQPSGEGVSTEEEPMMEIPPCKRKRTRDSSCVNPKWSELSEADQKIYLDISPLPDAFKPEALSHLDIALAVDHRLSDSEKMAFLTQCWQPSKSYNFYPVLQGSNRFPQLKWLSSYTHLVFSHREHGFYCLVCVLFGKKEVGQGGHQARGYFSERPFRKFKYFAEMWKGHSCNNYHKDSAITAEDFERAMTTQANVKQVISSGYSSTVNKNRRMIGAIFKAIRFCTRNELALRGHEDSGRFVLANPSQSEGLFRQTLRLMMDCGDVDAKLVLEAGSNASYLSPKIQNEMIKCFADVLLRPVVQRINDAPCFSILSDETGVHEREFLTICVIYLSNGKLLEDFLGYVSIADTSGEKIARAILDRLAELGINSTKMVGQGYDGAANMAGRIKGVQKRIRDQLPMALYFHCVAHNLNLVLSDAASTLHIDGVRKITVYFDGSSKRSDILRRWINEKVPESKRKKIA